MGFGTRLPGPGRESPQPEGPAMWTTYLAYLIAFMGFISFAGGAMGLLILMFEDMGETGWRLPMRYYAMVVGLISGGISMIGIAQGLRLLLLLVGRE